MPSFNYLRFDHVDSAGRHKRCLLALFTYEPRDLQERNIPLWTVISFPPGSWYSYSPSPFALLRSRKLGRSLVFAEQHLVANGPDHGIVHSTDTCLQRLGALPWYDTTLSPDITDNGKAVILKSIERLCSFISGSSTCIGC